MRIAYDRAPAEPVDRCARPDPRRAGSGGSGVAIALVDYGFDLLHPDFRQPGPRRSRFRALTDQATGVTLFSSEIERLIGACDRAGHRGAHDRVHDPHRNAYGPTGCSEAAHGTQMASIAAAIAPGADLIGIHLDLPDHAWQEIDPDGEPEWRDWQPAHGPWRGWRSYADQPAIARAIEGAYDIACGERLEGLVINLSIGTWAGPHDGRSAAESLIGEIVRRGEAGRGPATAVVVGAGNAGSNRGHFAGVASPEASAQFTWSLRGDADRPAKLEVWYEEAGGPAPTLEISPAGGTQRPDPVRLSRGVCRPIERDGRRIGIACHEAGTRGLGVVRLAIDARRLSPVDSAPDWSVTLSSPVTRRIHAWIERDDGMAPQSWLTPSEPEATLCCLAGASGAIVVAGYDGVTGGTLPFSSLGPPAWSDDAGPDSRVPHLSAPAHRIPAARSKTGGAMLTSGTSAAAAVASGAAAHAMGTLLRSGVRPTRALLLRALLGWRDPSPDEWSAAGGYGRLVLANPQWSPADERVVSPTR